MTHASFSAPDLPITLYLGGGDYHFTYPGDAAHPRLPPIFGNVIIHGNGAALHLHGINTESPADRLVVGQTGSLHLHHLHLKAGRGRAIVNYGTLHLTDSSLVNELGAPDYYLPDGGGIENRGTLTLTRSRLARNRLLTETTPGGALANYGTLEATCAIFEDNRAAQGGALWNAVGGTLHVSHSRFSGNQANGGGALYNADTSGAVIVEGYFGGGLPTIDDLYFGTDTLSQRVTYSISQVDYTLAAGCAAAAPVPPPTNVTVVPAGSSAPPPEVVPIEGVAEGKVAFVRNGQIFIKTLDGSSEQQITFPSSDNAWHRLPKWSPDGTKLAIVRFIGSNNHQMLIANLATETPMLTAVGQPYYYVSSLEWSPDGNQLLFVLPYSSTEHLHGAYTVNLDGSGRARLPISDPDNWQRVWSAAWSPNGEFLAFTHGGQNLQLFVMGDSSPLMWCQTASPVIWSPDSQAVGCISNEPPLFSQSYLRVVTVNPPFTARILANQIGWAGWSQHGQFIASHYDGTYIFDETGDFETTKRLVAQNISQADLSPDACVGYKYGSAPNVLCRLVQVSPTPTPTPPAALCTATVIDDPVRFRVSRDTSENSWLFRVNSDGYVQNAKAPTPAYPDLPTNDDSVTIYAMTWAGETTVGEDRIAWLDVIVGWPNLGAGLHHKTMRGYMAIRTSEQGNLLDVPCESGLPGYPTPTPTQPPTPTSIPQDRIRYVTCWNLTGPLRAFDTGIKTEKTLLLGEISRGSLVVLVDPAALPVVDGKIERVEIFLPAGTSEGNSKLRGFIAIRDANLPQDGDYLTPNRDPSCPAATPTFTPSPYSAPTLTPTPGDGRTELSGWVILNYDVTSIFSEPAAVVGSLQLHRGTIDLMPKSLEECMDKNWLSLVNFPSCMNQTFVVRSPVWGCVVHPIERNDQLYIAISANLINNCIEVAKYPRYELILSHLNSETISDGLKSTKFSKVVKPGDIIGETCPTGSVNCDPTLKNFVHLAVELRKADTHISSTEAGFAQISALLEAPCLYDKFQNDTSTSAQYDLTNFGRLLAEGKLLQTCPPDFDQTP